MSNSFERPSLEGENESGEKFEKPPILYHAVPNIEQEEIVEEFKPMSRHKDYESPAVFAATDKAAATMFLARSKDDWTAKSRFDDVYVMVIGDKDKWEKADRGGRIYALPSDTFSCDESKGWGKNEWASNEPVKPAADKTEEYSSALDAMIDNDVQVYFVDMEKLRELYQAHDQEADDQVLEYLRSIQSENQKRGKNALPLEDKQ